MTMTDYTLIATATATILLAAAWWWRRCSLQIRIFVQENGWFLGSLWLVQYVWYEITIHRPFQIGMLGAFRRVDRLARGPSPHRHTSHPAPVSGGTESPCDHSHGSGTRKGPDAGLPKPRDRRRCGRATQGRAPHHRDHPPSRQRRGAGLERNRRTHRQSGTRQSLPAVPGPNRNPTGLRP